jgi:hypothetical protein
MLKFYQLILFYHEIDHFMWLCKHTYTTAIPPDLEPLPGYGMSKGKGRLGNSHALRSQAGQ